MCGNQCKPEQERAVTPNSRVCKRLWAMHPAIKELNNLAVGWGEGRQGLLCRTFFAQPLPHSTSTGWWHTSPEMRAAAPPASPFLFHLALRFVCTLNYDWGGFTTSLKESLHAVQVTGCAGGCHSRARRSLCRQLLDDAGHMCALRSRKTGERGHSARRKASRNGCSKPAAGSGTAPAPADRTHLMLCVVELQLQWLPAAIRARDRRGTLRGGGEGRARGGVVGEAVRAPRSLARCHARPAPTPRRPAPLTYAVPPRGVSTPNMRSPKL